MRGVLTAPHAVQVLHIAGVNVMQFGRFQGKQRRRQFRRHGDRCICGKVEGGGSLLSEGWVQKSRWVRVVGDRGFV